MNRHPDVFQDVTSELYACYPALSNPAPLAPAKMPGFDGNDWQNVYDADSFLSYVHDLFADIGRRVEAGTYRLRNPARTTEGLVGPFLTNGTCLEPLIPHAATLRWIDPAEPATHGDIVTVVADQDMLAPHFRKGFEEDADFASMYARPMSNIIIKLLVHLNGQQLLVYRRGGFNIGNNRIIGVTRFMTTLDGRPLYGSGEGA